MLHTVATEVCLIIGLFLLNLLIKMQKVYSYYSLQEQKWVNVTLSELILVFVGFTIFRVITMNLATSDDRFFNQLIGLITFQITLNVIFLVVQLNSLSRLRQIKYEYGYETSTGQPESLLIHWMFIIILFFGTFVTMFVFILITFVLIYMFTVRILNDRQDLGNVTLMNRRNQAMLRTIR